MNVKDLDNERGNRQEQDVGNGGIEHEGFEGNPQPAALLPLGFGSPTTCMPLTTPLASDPAGPPIASEAYHRRRAQGGQGPKSKILRRIEPSTESTAKLTSATMQYRGGVDFPRPTAWQTAAPPIHQSQKRPQAQINQRLQTY